MRAFVLMLVLLAGGIAAAAEPVLVESVSQADWLTLQVVEGRLREAQLRLALAQSQFGAKYRLAEGDSVDPKTLAVHRVAKPKVRP